MVRGLAIFQFAQAVVAHNHAEQLQAMGRIATAYAFNL